MATRIDDLESPVPPEARTLVLKGVEGSKYGANRKEYVSRSDPGRQGVRPPRDDLSSTSKLPVCRPKQGHRQRVIGRKSFACAWHHLP